MGAVGAMNFKVGMLLSTRRMLFGLVALLGIVGNLRAQAVDTVALRSLGEASSSQLYDTALGLQFRDSLLAYLQQHGGLAAAVPRLQGLADIRDSLRTLRILTWGHRLRDHTWCYLGLVVHQLPGESPRYYPLRDRRIPVGQGLVPEEWLFYRCSPNDWVGAVYFDIIPFALPTQETAYLLVGVAGATDFVTRRVVEVLQPTEQSLLFGMPYISYGRQHYGRLIFAHGSRVGMNMLYLSKFHLLLMDHLSPAKEEYFDMPQYYGPDFSFDALRLQPNGRWLFEPNVDVRPYLPEPRKRPVRQATGHGNPQLGQYVPNWKH